MGFGWVSYGVWTLPMDLHLDFCKPLEWVKKIKKARNVQTETGKHHANSQNNLFGMVKTVDLFCKKMNFDFGRSRSHIESPG